jgi:hypothetical protein
MEVTLSDQEPQVTFLSAPLAVDGAELNGALIRKGTYAAMGGAEGLVERADLKVSQLAVAGNGLLISAGNAVVLNRYQTTPNEAYVAANPSVHTVTAGEMPASQPSAKSYLVLVTIGDQEFSQVGHPWMTSDPLDPEDAVDFQYVRPWLLEVPAGTTSADGLGLTYPAYALARIDRPANTTTITNAMIVDLRTMARPRFSEELFITSSEANNDLQTVSPTYEQFPRDNYSIKIPKWATKAKVTAFVEGMSYNGAVDANLRINFVGVGSGANVPVNHSAPASGSDRCGVNLATTFTVTSYAGQTKSIEIQGQAASSGYANRLHTDSRTLSSIRVRFEEAPI